MFGRKRKKIFESSNFRYCKALMDVIKKEMKWEGRLLKQCYILTRYKKKEHEVIVEFKK